ncbi:LysM peptidoglycan-binding domain-containing protein [Paenibacillus sp. FSL W8-0187]|uniref:LysM peptidoglycan-binding domain-containing protein n=1 Tax=Paenibacillus sp. FSL W8-0187 TaxID=2921710 RepID=UPI0030D8BC54
MKIYIVKEGDTLYELSKKYDVPLAKIIDANPQLVDPNKLDVGAKIKLPTEPVPVPGGSQPIIHKHTVKQGDSLWKLSKAWGVTLKEIIDANPQLKNPNALLVGEVVNIPSSGVYSESGADDGGSMSSGSGLNPGKKKPGSKDYTGVKEEITAPIEQPPVVPEVKEPEPLILPKLPEISPFPEEPKKFEPEYKPEILPEIKKPVILPEVMKPEILPEVKKPEVMPDFKKPAIMPAIMPDFKPEFKPEFKPDFKPPYKPIEPEYTYPVKTMPLPHPIHPMAEPCPPFAEMPLHMMPHPCPEFPFQEAPAFMMPPYGGFHEGPCGCHEPKHWHGSDYGTAVHPYHHIPQEAMPVSYNEGWGDAASGYPGVSEQPMSLEYSQFSITESYTGNMGSDYHPYPEHHHTAPTYGYVPSPCGCHGGEVSPHYNMPQHGHYQHAPDMAVPYQPWQGGMDYNARPYGYPSELMGTQGAYPPFENPYEQNWYDRQNDQQLDSAFNPSAPFEAKQSNMSISSEVENDTKPSVSRDTAIEENAKERAKVHRQQANKTRTAAKKSRKPQVSSKGKRHNPWIKG